MKLLIALIIFCALNERSIAFFPCMSRINNCFANFEPACARKFDGSIATYSNGCIACLDSQVKGYDQGACQITTIRVPRPSNSSQSPASTIDLKIYKIPRANFPTVYVPVPIVPETNLTSSPENKGPLPIEYQTYVQTNIPDEKNPGFKKTLYDPSPQQILKLFSSTANTTSSSSNKQKQLPSLNIPASSLVPSPSKQKQLPTPFPTANTGIGTGTTVTPPAGGFPAGVTPCTSRSKACTYIYLPVCGKKYDGSSATYPSNCNACSDASVYGYVSNECPTRQKPSIPVKPAQCQNPQTLGSRKGACR